MKSIRVLCEYSPGAHILIRGGWANAMLSINSLKTQGSGVSVTWDWWSPHEPIHEPAFDALNRFFSKPADWYIVLSTTYAPVEFFEYFYTKDLSSKIISMALFAFLHGPMRNEMDLKKYPVPFATPEEITRVKRLKETIGKPDFAFVHCSRYWLDHLLGGWQEEGIPIQGILNGADIIRYHPVSPRTEFACDVAFVGSYWEYKARNFDKWLLPVCGKFPKTKIFGLNRWPCANYLGPLSSVEELALYSSARVCVNVSEPHSNDYGFDVVERPFKTGVCNTRVLSDYVFEAENIFDGKLEMAKSPKEFLEKIQNILEESPEERFAKQHALTENILGNHTYHHRVWQMIENFQGIPDEWKRKMGILLTWALKKTIKEKHPTHYEANDDIDSVFANFVT